MPGFPYISPSYVQVQPFIYIGAMSGIMTAKDDERLMDCLQTIYEMTENVIDGYEETEETIVKIHDLIEDIFEEMK